MWNLHVTNTLKQMYFRQTNEMILNEGDSSMLGNINNALRRLNSYNL